MNVSILNNAKHRLDVRASYNYNDNFVESTGGAPEFSVGGFTFLGSFVKADQPLGYLRGARAIQNPDGTFTIERNQNLGTTFSPNFGTFAVNYTYNNTWSFFLNGDYQFGGQGVNVDDVLRFFGGVNDEGRIPQEAIDANLSFFDLAGYWVEDANYLKIRTIGTTYTFRDVWNSRIDRLEIGFNVQNALNFVSSSFDPDVTGAGIRTQGGFAGGGFAFGTESAPRIYL